MHSPSPILALQCPEQQSSVPAATLGAVRVAGLPHAWAARRAVKPWHGACDVISSCRKQQFCDLGRLGRRVQLCNANS